MKENDLSFKLKDIESAYNTLMRAKNLSNKGEYKESEKICKELITNFPKYYAAHRELAKIYIEQKQFYSAFQHLALALSGDQSDYFSLLNLEALTYELEFFETGQDLSELIEIVGKKYGIKQHSDVHFLNKGKILLKNHEYINSAIEFEKCLHADPQNEEIALKLIESYEAIGKYKESLELIEKFISGSGSKKNNFIYLLSAFPKSLIQKNVKRYITIANNLNAEGEEETQRLFSLARFYHMEKKYAQAWSEISKANERVKLTIGNKHLDDKNWEENILRWAKDTEFNVPPISDDEPETLPLYMLGPSRSGKSCLEKALEWIPGIKLGFENKLLSNATSRAFNTGDRLPATFLPFLPDQLLPEFVSCYRSMFRETTQGTKIFTTTTPGLITAVPAIVYALPKAKFIFLKRNPLDTAFRMYFKHYRNSHFHSYDINWSLDYIKWYYDLADIWRIKFPNAILTIEYESLVTKPTENINNIMTFLGINKKVPNDLVIPNDSGFSDPYHALYK